ncbi:MAG TPA: glycosyltransferase [Candidatus Dormibacteraeota bacterium]
MDNVDRAEVQIWAAATGGGHLSVARALAAALRVRSGGMVGVALDDPIQAPIGHTSRSLARAYGPLVRTSPALWGLLFRGFSTRNLSSAMEHFLLRQLGPAMAARTRRRAPLVVVNCHPLLGPAAMAGARSSSDRVGPPALVTVMTDLVGGHPGWLSPPPDAIVAPTKEARAWCLAHGLESGAIHETGLPVDPELSRPFASAAERARLRFELGLDPARLTVLVGGGAEGAGNLRRLVGWLEESGLPLQVVVACGRNRRLRHWLVGRSARVPTLTLDFQESLTPWLRASDVYLGKAGPSALAEAAAAGLALLVAGSLPGQEENNGAALVAAGAALIVRDRDDLLRAMARLCRPSDPLRDDLRRGALAWSRPAAAAAAADLVLSFLPMGAAGLPLQERSASGSAAVPPPRR